MVFVDFNLKSSKSILVIQDSGDRSKIAFGHRFKQHLLLLEDIRLALDRLDNPDDGSDMFPSKIMPVNNSAVCRTDPNCHYPTITHGFIRRGFVTEMSSGGIMASTTSGKKLPAR